MLLSSKLTEGQDTSQRQFRDDTCLSYLLRRDLGISLDYIKHLFISKYVQCLSCTIEQNIIVTWIKVKAKGI